MAKNKIIVDSGFGSYLKQEQPKAIANEFLYYNPSLLFLIDEMYCDVNAMKEELNWADQGFLVSHLSILLEQKDVIKNIDFSPHFDDATKHNLIAESNNDLSLSVNQNLLPYFIPELENNKSSRNKFFDINSLLFLSGRLDLPFLNTDPTRKYFNWKFKKWQENTPNNCDKELLVNKQMFDIFTPNLIIFPRNKLFSKAEQAKQRLFTVTNQHDLGKASQLTLKRTYQSYLDAWLKYDQHVKSEAVDNFNFIMELRRDKRITRLREFISNLSAKLSIETNSPEVEVSLKIKKELLQIEYDIAEHNKDYDWLDKYSKYMSFPTQAFSTIGGAVASYLTQDPIFIALGLYPGLIDFTAQNAKNLSKRKYVWKSYFHDVKGKIERRNSLKTIEKDLNGLNKL